MSPLGKRIVEAIAPSLAYWYIRFLKATVRGIWKTLRGEPVEIRRAHDVVPHEAEVGPGLIVRRVAVAQVAVAVRVGVFLIRVGDPGAVVRQWLWPHYHRGPGCTRVLLCRGLPSAVSGKKSRRLLRHGWYRCDLRLIDGPALPA